MYFDCTLPLSSSNQTPPPFYPPNFVSCFLLLLLFCFDFNTHQVQFVHSINCEFGILSLEHGPSRNACAFKQINWISPRNSQLPIFPQPGVELYGFLSSLTLYWSCAHGLIGGNSSVQLHCSTRKIIFSCHCPLPLILPGFLPLIILKFKIS